jgi:hypothetical protein
LNLFPSMGQNLEHRQGLLRLLVGANVHQHGTGFPVLRDYDGLPFLLKLVQYFGRMSLYEADGLDLS